MNYPSGSSENFPFIPPDRTASPVTVFALALIFCCFTRNKLSFPGYSQTTKIELAKNCLFIDLIPENLSSMSLRRSPEIYILSSSQVVLIQVIFEPILRNTALEHWIPNPTGN